MVYPCNFSQLRPLAVMCIFLHGIGNLCIIVWTNLQTVMWICRIHFSWQIQLQLNTHFNSLKREKMFQLQLLPLMYLNILVYFFMWNYRITKKLYPFDCAWLLLKCKNNSAFIRRGCCLDDKGFMHIMKSFFYKYKYSKSIRHIRG